MARVICRCGETLMVPSRDLEHLVCSRCGAKVRLRRKAVVRNGSAPPTDGYIRFPCPCGRRLKVRRDERLEVGRCPDCGRVLPVPLSDDGELPGFRGTASGSLAGSSESNTRTAELDLTDLERLGQWSDTHRLGAVQQNGSTDRIPNGANQVPESRPIMVPSTVEDPSAIEREAGLRICHSCGTPLHINATFCRSCGGLAPKQLPSDIERSS
jgi:ribosomal protein L40E